MRDAVIDVRNRSIMLSTERGAVRRSACKRGFATRIGRLQLSKHDLGRTDIGLQLDDMRARTPFEGRLGSVKAFTVVPSQDCGATGQILKHNKRNSRLVLESAGNHYLFPCTRAPRQKRRGCNPYR